MGVPLKWGCQKKVKLSNHTCKTHEIFRVGKYKKEIKLDKIWVYHYGGIPQTWPPKFQL